MIDRLRQGRDRRFHTSGAFAESEGARVSRSRGLGELLSSRARCSKCSFLISDSDDSDTSLMKAHENSQTKNRTLSSSLSIIQGQRACNL